MDAARLLVQARDLSLMDQGHLARRAGVARSSITAYEKGRQSPTVRQLGRLLAACDLRAEVRLVRSGLSVGDRVVEAMTSWPDADEAALELDSAELDRAGVRWAVDSWAALALHGVAVSGPTAYAVVCDSAFRAHVSRRGMRALDRWGQLYGVPMDESRTRLDDALARGPVLHGSGRWMHLRLVDELGPVTRVRLERGHDVPVLGLLEIAAAHPDAREVVTALLERGGLP